MSAKWHTKKCHSHVTGFGDCIKEEATSPFPTLFTTLFTILFTTFATVTPTTTPTPTPDRIMDQPSDHPTVHALGNFLILTEIFSHLTCQHHIYACSRVSRAFFTTTIILLWRRPRIYKPHLFSLFAGVLAQSESHVSSTSTTLRPYSTYVHELDITYLALVTPHPTDLTLCLSYLPNLRTLDLRRSPHLTDSLLFHILTHCPRLTRLSLKSNPLTEIGALTAFSCARSLEFLYIENSFQWCTDAVVIHILNSCLTLRYLTILGCKRLTGIGLASVRGTALRGLRCRHVGATSRRAVREIMRCAALEEVDFGSGIAVGRNDVAAMVEGSTRAMEEAALADNNEPRSAQTSRIRRLCLNLGEESTDEELLRALDLYGSTRGGILAELDLRFWGAGVTERSLRAIGEMCWAGLRRLRLERWCGSAGRGDEVLAEVLARMGMLEVLELSECSFRDTVIDAVVEHSAGRITELKIEDMMVSEEALVRAVRGCGKLRSLYVVDCWATDMVLRELRMFGRGLRKLSFDCETVGEEAWAAVCEGCPWLEFLELSTIAEVPRGVRIFFFSLTFMFVLLFFPHAKLTIVQNSWSPYL